jgi:hypothetical protein
MDKAKTTRSQQQTPSQPSTGNGDKAAKGYPAVTRFAQAPAPSADGGNGLPHQLRQGVEALSGMSMAGTSVHYNSSAPAQIGALAYAAGNQIHLGPGQEQHLPHEAWHIVQQKQGRVKPTLQAKGLDINDDPSLETEADMMGQRAAQLQTAGYLPTALPNLSASQPTDVVQRKIGFEFQAVKSIFLSNTPKSREKLGKKMGSFDVEGDGGTEKNKPELELVTTAVEETEKGRKELVKIMTDIVSFLEFVIHGQPIARPPFVVWTNDLVEKKDTFNLLAKKKFLGQLTEEEFSKQTAGFSKYDIPTSEKHFHPQATVGVKFEKVADLINYVTNAPIKRGGRVVPESATSETKEIKADPGPTSGGEAPKTETKVEATPQDIPNIINTPVTDPQEAASIFGWGAKKYHTTYRKTSREGFDGIDDKEITPKVKALAAMFNALARNRLVEYKEAIGKPKYLKDMMPFMLRNGFWPFIDSLSLEELLQLENIAEINKVDWNRKIMRPTFARKDFKETKNSIPTVLAVFKHLLEKKAAGPADREDQEDLLQKADVAGYGEITKGALIKKGQVAADIKDHKKTFRMEAIDDIGISDSENTRRHGALIELRKLGSEVPAEKLTEFALAVFDLIVLINGPESSSSSSLSSSSSSSSPPPPPSSSSSSSQSSPSSSSWSLSSSPTPV